MTKRTKVIEGNTRYFTKEDQDWWNYKVYNPVEEPEEGKGIEEYFTSLDNHITTPEEFISEKKSVISFAGDIMPIPIYEEGIADHLFDEIEDYYFDADLAVANLESPLTPSQKARYDVFPPQLTSDTFWFNTIYREGKGINVLSTANNHSLDMGVDGLFETCEFLNKTGVTWVGTGRTKEERDDLPVVERSGIKYGFLSWTFGLNNYENPEDKPYLSNHLRINLENPDLSPITRDVEILRKKGADVIVGLIHWSLEFECWPMAHLIETGHRLLSECGIDIVSGNHAHNVQPVEVYRYEKDGVKKQGIIFYAHGDLVSAISMCKNEVLNYISRVQVEKGTLNGIEQTIISGFDLLPTYRYGVNDQNNKNCVLYQQLFKLDKLVSMVENGEELPFEISEEKRLHILHLKKLVQRVIPYAYSDYNQLSFNAEVVTGI